MSDFQIYTGNNGKWFFPINPKDSQDVEKPYYWAGNPPDTSQAYFVDNGTKKLIFQPLEDTDASKLSLVDNACSGRNSSESSAQYYTSIKHVKEGKTVANNTLCLAGTQPISLVNESSWVKNGCSLGFLCELIFVCSEIRRLFLTRRRKGQNNTVTRLPQWCPPTTACNTIRQS